MRERIFKIFRRDENKITALHSYLFNTGFYIRIEKDFKLDKPFYLLSGIQGNGVGLFSHSVVELGKNSSLFLIQDRRYNPEFAIATSVMEVFLEEGSELCLINIDGSGEEVYSYYDLNFQLGMNSKLSILSGWFGGRKTHVKTNSILGEAGAELKEKHISFGLEEENFDIISSVKYTSPHTKSDIHMKGVAGDNSIVFLKSLLNIGERAKEVSAYTKQYVLIINPGAEVHLIPSLEILNSDVKAGHSASVENIEDEEIFYLMTRGLSLTDSKRLIVSGFLLPTREKIKIDLIPERINSLIEKKINRSKIDG